MVGVEPVKRFCREEYCFSGSFDRHGWEEPFNWPNSAKASPSAGFF